MEDVSVASRADNEVSIAIASAEDRIGFDVVSFAAAKSAQKNVWAGDPVPLVCGDL